jgi:glycosyltransferase involved in cell wall biosynthesis
MSGCERTEPDSSVRIAICVYLAPRKLGSMEQWLVGLCEESTQRGHSVGLFLHPPIHPFIAERLRTLGVPWTPIHELEGSPLSWGRRLRKEFDAVYLNLAAPRGRGALAAYLAWPLPVLFFEGTSGAAAGNRGRSLASRLLDRWTFVRVTALAGASHYVVERDRERFGLAPARCSVIYNGIDTERFRPVEQPRAGPPTIIAVANLIREKGIDVLIEACRMLQEVAWKLVIVGDGPEEPALRRLAAAAGVGERIEFTGLRDDVERCLREADIYAHPAVWQEAFGLTITEAMASGCATIASRVGGIPEIIEDGKSGMLVAPGDPRALAGGLRRLLSDPGLRGRLAQEGRSRVIERFPLGGSVRGQLDWIEHWAQQPQRGLASSAA